MSEGDAEEFAEAVKAKAARAGGWVSVLCTDEDSIDEITPELSNLVLGEPKSDIVTYKDDGGVNYNCAYMIGPALSEDYEHEHSWTGTTYFWEPNCSKVSAFHICQSPNCDYIAQMETAKTKSKITRKPTETAKGQTTYTAAFKTQAFKASKTLTNIPKIVKKTNPMKVKVTAKTLKYKKLKKNALVVAPIAVTSAKGKVTYKVVGGNAKSKKALSLNTKTGKVTAKKKTKKGQYQIKVKVTAAGTTKYKALSKTVTVTVNVK